MLKLQDLHRLAESGEDSELEGRDYGLAQRKEVFVIRKENRNTLFKKRRSAVKQSFVSSTERFQQSQENVHPALTLSAISKDAYALLHRIFLPNEIEELADKIKSDKLLQKLQGAIGLRCLMSLQEPPIDRAIQLGAVAQLIAILSQSQCPYLRLEAAWALADIASGSKQQSQYLVNHNCIDIFHSLMQSKCQPLLNQCVWFFGNIACSNQQDRDTILKKGIMKNLVETLEFFKDQEAAAENCVWAISNLCRGKPLPQYDLVSEGIEAIAQTLAEGKLSTEQSFLEGLFAISHHSGPSTKQSRAIMDTNLYLKLVDIMNQGESHKLLIISIRIVSSIMKNPRNVDKLIDAGVLDGIERSLAYRNRNVYRMAFESLVSILKSKSERGIQQLLDRREIVYTLKILLEQETEKKRLQIAVAFCEMCLCFTLQLDIKLIELDILPLFHPLLDSDYPSIIQPMLKALEIPLMHSALKSQNRKSQNLIAVEMNRVGIASAIERLQSHQEPQIYTLTSEILQIYFLLQDTDQSNSAKKSKKGKSWTIKSQMQQKRAEYASSLH